MVQTEFTTAWCLLPDAGCVSTAVSLQVKRKGSDEFDVGMMSGCGGELGIARQQRCVKGFCQGNIGRVVGGHIVAELPDSGQKQIMRVTGQRKVGEVFHGLKTPGCIEFAGKRLTTKDLGDFDIEQAGRMKRLLPFEKPLGYSRPRRRVEQHLDQGRGVYNDHLPSLSALTALAGETLVVTDVRWARRLRSSAAVGRSAMRCTS
jgi:hypothetical protein